MSRINTNVDSIIALHNLERANRGLTTTLTRISTGVRVNSGKDDPSALISGNFLRQEISQTEAAIRNNNRSLALISTADAALGEVANLLDSIQGIITTVANDATLSAAEKLALQTQVDSAIDSITRISNTTTFAGNKLLDGTLGFQVSGLQLTSNAITDVRIHQLPTGIESTNPLNVTVSVFVTFEQASFNAAALGNVGVAVGVSGDVTSVQIRGSEGSAVVDFTFDITGTVTTADFDTGVNTVSDLTGVTSTGGVLNSIEYGEDEFVELTQISGTNIIDVGGTLSVQSDFGRDVEGTINGLAFEAIGRRVYARNSLVDIELTLGTGQATSGINTITFQVSGGGAQFQVGPEVNEAGQFNLGLGSVNAGVLGGDFLRGGLAGRLSEAQLGGSFDLLSDPENASRIVSLATEQVADLRGRLGAFAAYTLESSINSQQVAIENLSAARSLLIDTDFAAETANLARFQILVQASTSALAIANARPESVLALLSA